MIERIKRSMESLFSGEIETVKVPDALTEADLIYSATVRCPCGAGVAYWRGAKAYTETGYWDCSDILLGRAIPQGQDGAKTHTGRLPFVFYDIKSENQPSAFGRTTRPEKRN